MRGHAAARPGGDQDLGNQVQLGGMTGVPGPPAVQGARQRGRVAAQAALQRGQLHPAAEGVRGRRPILLQRPGGGAAEQVPDRQPVAGQVAVPDAVALGNAALARRVQRPAELRLGVRPNQLTLPAVRAGRLLRVWAGQGGQGLLGAPLGQGQAGRDNVRLESQGRRHAAGLDLGLDLARGRRVARGPQAVRGAEAVGLGRVLAPGLGREPLPGVGGLPVA
ncbi:MAG: hypothetical protein MUF66_15775, partial [Gammaproteobacteria bacterium]|nr:hypothetical protein [Gammaproteobacteria bacterium]